jgi:integrase
MFEVAVDYGIAGNNPVRRKLHRARSTSARKPVLTVDEVVKVISHAAEEFRSLLTMISVTGLRLGELLGLRWQDVDLAGGVIRIASSLWRGELQSPKTEESVRELHIPAGLVSVLSAHRQSSAFDGDGDFVFCKADESPCDPDVLRKDVLYPAMDRAGIKRGRRTHGFHIFRYTAGTLAYQKTGDIKAAQNLLGHARISTTADIYAHHDHARTAAAMKAIEDGFSGFAHPPTVLTTPQTVVH